MPPESEEEVSLLEHLLHKEGQETFDAMANELWHSDSSDDITARLQRLVEEIRGAERK
jgi:predicted transcriptional regulator